MPERSLRPLRQHSSDDEGPHSPEALAISALLDTGMFIPEAYRLEDDHLACYQKLWRFARTYQQQTGMAPAIELVKAKFPDFAFTPGVDPGWAAGKLHEAAANRDIRRRIHAALQALDTEDLTEAVSELSDLKLPKRYRKEPTGVFDHSLLEEEDDELAIDVPWRTLAMATGGIRSAETWAIAGRQWSGKSMLANLFCKSASTAGFRVRWITLEMPKRSVARRLWKVMAGRDADLRRQLDSDDVYDRKAALDILTDRYPVIPEIIDRGDGPCTVNEVRESLEEADLTILDHIGLLKTSSGGRMVDDHRIMAATSQQLREDVLTTNSCLLYICHANREGDSDRRPPKLKHLAESDWLGRDASVVITLCPPSPSTRLLSLEKNREGLGAMWNIRFDVNNARYDEINKETAEDLKLVDEERAII